MSITSITHGRDDGGASNIKKSQQWPKGACMCCVFPGVGGGNGGGTGRGSTGLKGELESSFIHCCHASEQGRAWGRGLCGHRHRGRRWPLESRPHHPQECAQGNQGPPGRQGVRSSLPCLPFFQPHPSVRSLHQQLASQVFILSSPPCKRLLHPSALHPRTLPAAFPPHPTGETAKAL